jgi:hypothetical protein
MTLRKRGQSQSLEDLKCAAFGQRGACNGKGGAAKLAERDKRLVKVLFGPEPTSELKGFREFNSLAHPDSMPKFGSYFGGNHISIVASNF